MTIEEWCLTLTPLFVGGTQDSETNTCSVKGVACSTQGRVSLNDAQGFGLHVVNCSLHPSGPMVSPTAPTIPTLRLPLCPYLP